MAADSASTNSKERLFLVISLVLAPAILLYFALDYFERQKNSQLLESARLQLMEPLNNIKQYKNIEAFWCATLNEEIYNSGSPVELSERIERLAKITGEQLKYVIWRGRSRVECSNFLTRDQFKAWNDLINDAKKAHGLSESTEKREIENRVKMLLGPHYLAENLNLSQNVEDPHFIRPDNAGHFPIVWMNYENKFSAVVLFKPDVITRDHRLKLFFNSRQPAGNRLHLIDTRNLANLTGEHATALKAACFSFISNGKEISQIDNRLIGIVRVSPVEFVANLTVVEDCTGDSGRNTMLTTLLTLFALIIAMRSKPDLLHPNNISIRLQLLTLLFICSGLPLLSLALGGLEHLKQQREHLIRSAYQTCIEYIQEIDRRKSGEYSRIMQQSYRTANEFKRLLQAGATEKETIVQTFSTMHPSRNEFRAIASSANYLISHTGIYRDGVFNKYSTDSFRRTNVPTEIKLINDIGSYYLNFMNRAQIDPERYAEIELLTEMFYRKNLTEIVHELLLITDNIAVMGWGTTTFPVFVKLVSIHDPKIVDFFFWAAYNPDQINRAYIARQTDNLRRNEFGLNVFFNDKFNVFPLDPGRDNSELIDLFERTGTHPALEPQLCTYDRQNWIIAGFKGNLLNNFKIIALYPMSRIDDAIEKEGQFIIYSVLAAFTILVSLTLLFGHSFTVPLAHLQSAAEAVEKRDFGFKLPDLGRDEFGEMGRVFNRSIAELEELAIASIVQSRLMPAKTIEAGHFDVFGRSIPMADLGGDYYDYFSVGDDSFAVLLGDVAGHGVGASLIMAMAKTGITCCEKWHDQPLKVLENLHQLICTTRSKTQRKIMTFQYLCFDKLSGVGKYANAGGCSPILVCPDNSSASEVTLNGPVLGGFKKSRFSEIEMHMLPGQALVLYTDGIIETKNPAGVEIGYERFKEWLLKNYNSDAEAYYHAVYAEYLQWLADGSSQDDLTLIMLVYKGQNMPGNTLLHGDKQP